MTNLELIELLIKSGSGNSSAFDVLNKNKLITSYNVGPTIITNHGSIVPTTHDISFDFDIKYKGYLIKMILTIDKNFTVNQLINYLKEWITKDE